MAVALALVLLLLQRQRRNSQDDFRYDALGAAQYQFKLHPHTEHYQTLKANFPENAADIRPLQRALFERALVNIPLVMQITHEANQASQLYKRSMISESAWRAIRKAEDTLKAEMDDVSAEADELQQGWGAEIWQQAMHVHVQSQERQAQAAAAAEAAEKEQRTQANRAKREKQKERQKAKKAGSAAPPPPTPEEAAERARKELEEQLAAEEERKAAAQKQRSVNRRGSKKGR
ncbi:hypothetical protein JKP88DRAFT_255005 [Tribonema minus]|uniref:Uncharacterized protein n=1 Tax=Tribonema minus TaxID=303371 RepID=A0A836CGU4_9STRA|nr:hypothetical protein JKP88DRAFT_255005 [Tribonema minus]